MVKWGTIAYLRRLIVKKEIVMAIMSNVLLVLKCSELCFFFIHYIYDVNTCIHIL